MYSKPDCAACHEARALLESKGVSVTEIIIDGVTAVVSAISALGDRQGFPQIFIGSRRIGGLESLQSFDAAGKLDVLLKHL